MPVQGRSGWEAGKNEMGPFARPDHGPKASRDGVEAQEKNQEPTGDEQGAVEEVHPGS